MNRHLTATFILLLVWTSASHGNPLRKGASYASFQHTTFTYKSANSATLAPQDLKPTALVTRIGSFLANNIAVESRAGLGLKNDSFAVSADTESTRAEMEIDRLLGLYLVGHFPLGRIASAYGVYGYTNLKHTRADGFASFAEKNKGTSYGAGIDLYVTRSFGLNAEHLRYLKKKDYKLSAFSLGIKFHY